jgi:nucleoside diphosphate kinase
MHPRKERTLVILKPDAIQRTLMGEIVGRYERVGLKLVAMKMIVATPEHIEQHYTLDPQWRQVTGEKTIQGYISKGLTPPVTDSLRPSHTHAHPAGVSSRRVGLQGGYDA